MHKFAVTIPNKIKQPSQCCIYCGKSYVKRTNLDKHIITCELLNRSKNNKPLLLEGKGVMEEEQNDNYGPIPSQKHLYIMLIELGKKYNQLEEKLEQMNKCVVKRKNKINLLNWLNENVKINPNIFFETIINTIIITEQDIEFLLEHTFNEMLDEIFARNIYNLKENETPIFAFKQKKNVFYIYSLENSWKECEKELMKKFLNQIHTKIIKVFSSWKKTSVIEKKSRENDSFAIQCNNSLIKIMKVDYTQETILTKIIGNMYSKMEIDIDTY